MEHIYRQAARSLDGCMKEGLFDSLWRMSARNTHLEDRSADGEFRPEEREACVFARFLRDEAVAFGVEAGQGEMATHLRLVELAFGGGDSECGVVEMCPAGKVVP